jgi:hypothetical protein
VELPALGADRFRFFASRPLSFCRAPQFWLKAYLAAVTILACDGRKSHSLASVCLVARWEWPYDGAGWPVMLRVSSEGEGAFRNAKNAEPLMLRRSICGTLCLGLIWWCCALR